MFWKPTTPLVVAQPSWSTFSLIVTGTPCSAPSASPFATARSARFAASRAVSDRSTVTALSLGLTSAMRPIHASTASRAEMSRLRIAAAMRVALQRQMGSVGIADESRCCCKAWLGAWVCTTLPFRLISPGASVPRGAERTMGLIAVGGFQHETNTFAPSKAGYAAFEDGGGWPPITFGVEIAPRLAGANIPAAGAIAALHAMGHRTAGLVWGAASPSAHVTRDAYERIVAEMLA